MLCDLDRALLIGTAQTERRRVVSQFRFDSSVSIGGQLSRKDIDRLAMNGFRSILNLSQEGEPGQLLSPNVEASWAHANAMEHSRVSVSFDHPQSRSVDRFLEKLDELPRPVYVHSETGRRAAAFLTIVLALDRRIPGDQALAAAESMGLDCNHEPLKRFVRAEVERRLQEVPRTVTVR